MSSDREKPDVLRVKKDAVSGFHFHYNRDERLALKGDAAGPERKKRERVRKMNTVLLIVLGVAVGVLVFLLLFKYFL